MDLLLVVENSTTHTPAYRSSLEAVCLPPCNNDLFSSGTNQKSRFVQVRIRKHAPRFIQLAGVSGFEPENAGFKVLCLTAWLHPNGWRCVQDSNLQPLGCLHISLYFINYFLQFIIFSPNNSSFLAVFCCFQS